MLCSGLILTSPPHCSSEHRGGSLGQFCFSSQGQPAWSPLEQRPFPSDPPQSGQSSSGLILQDLSSSSASSGFRLGGLRAATAAAPPDSAGHCLRPLFRLRLRLHYLEFWTRTYIWQSSRCPPQRQQPAQSPNQRRRQRPSTWLPRSPLQ